MVILFDSTPRMYLLITMNFDRNGEKKSHMTLNDLSLNALRCFSAAAREESFSRAGAALHLTHGAISRAVRLLEDELGVALFERRNRRVFLTENGRKLFEAVEKGLSIIDAAAKELRSTGPALNVSCEPTLMMRWLIPRLPDFRIRYPDIHIQLSAGGGFAELASDADLAIRRNDFAWPAHWHAAHLFSERVGPVCRATQSAQMTRIDAHGDLQLAPGITLLHTRTRSDAWSVWSRLAEVSLKEVKSQEFEHFYFSIQAAVAGLGMSIGPWLLVRDDCESGVLHAPFGFIEDGSAYYLLGPKEFDAKSSAAIFYRWLLEQEKNWAPA